MNNACIVTSTDKVTVTFHRVAMTPKTPIYPPKDPSNDILYSEFHFGTKCSIPFHNTNYISSSTLNTNPFIHFFQIAANGTDATERR